MKISISLALGTTFAAFCLAAMLTVTLVWLYLPIRIVYQQSSPVQTETYSIEVRQHGHSYFVTPKQKQILDLIRSYTSVIWFSCFAYLLLFAAVGGFARLRLLWRRSVMGDG